MNADAKLIPQNITENATIDLDDNNLKLKLKMKIATNNNRH